ncbi:MAG: excinuclease ABC subunit UvrC [Microscillaceae bacterium]|jgi:excinuclease ABC subunit C|nr:excinuclease ABC subunit UvrC [Microscillaceae bacterium]
MENKILPKEVALKLPHDPGVYKFFDKENTLLYVGKAKNLKNRVSSYFNQSANHSRKTMRLVAQIDHIEFTVVNTEYDALLLENSLIKNHQPKYNILLKDDKTYPYICVTNEPFARVLVTRRLDRSQGTFYGPFTNIRAMNTVLNLIKELYTIRTCSLNLTKENIDNQKFKVCLEYHIGNCKGPCEGWQTRLDYDQDVEQVQQILKGDLGIVKTHFREQMLQYAQNLEFEKAEVCKQSLAKLEGFQSKSLVVNPKMQAVDVLTIISDEEFAYLNYLKIKDGAIIYTNNHKIKKNLEEADAEILTMLAIDLRIEGQSQAPEIISNVGLSIDIEGFMNTIPKIGDKKKLLDLSLKNVLFFKRESAKPTEKPISDNTANKAVLELQKALQMNIPPMQIECFDNSNIQGTNPVASMVCFKNGKPYKKEYRHFNIKTVEGPNDFASMYEIVTRRYKRQLAENQALPDLIIIDGGKGQLSSACQALKDLEVYGKMPIIGIAKRLEEIYFPEDEIPLHISKKSLALKLIQRIRDEAHRFAIEFHRLKRSQNSLQTQLENIKGFGENTITTLLTKFKTIKNIQNATDEQLLAVIGKAKTKLLRDYFAELAKNQ